MENVPDYVTPSEGRADIALTKAYTLGGVECRCIGMREPTVADQLAMDHIKGGDAAKEIGFLANLCELTPADIQKLSLRDYKRLQTAIGLFID